MSELGLSDAEREAMIRAREAGVSASVRRMMGEPVESDEDPLEMTGEEKFGFDAGWMAARDFYAR